MGIRIIMLPSISRKVLRRPVATFIVVALVAIGFAAFVTAFSVVDAIELEPLRVPGPQQLVLLRWTANKRLPRAIESRYLGYNEHALVPYYVFKAVQENCGQCSDVLGEASLGTGPVPVHLTVGTRRLQLFGEAVTDDYFKGLGLVPALGRLFQGDHGSNEVVISRRLWEDAFGRDQEIVGKQVALDGGVYTIVGVMEAGYSGIEQGRQADFWVPVKQWPSVEECLASPTVWCITVIARANEGAPLRQVQASIGEMAAAAVKNVAGNDVAKTDLPILKGMPGSKGVGLVSGLLRPYLRMLILAAGSATGVAWIGIVFLQLWVMRLERVEYAVRRALGASSGQILLQAALEAAGPVAIGVVIGTGGALLMSRILRVSLGSMLAGAGLEPPHLQIDWRIAAVACSLTACAVAISGLVPGLLICRMKPWTVLSQGSSGTDSVRRGWYGLTWMMGAEIAICFSLVLGAALLVHSAIKLYQVDLGYQPDHLVLADVSSSSQLSAAASSPSNIGPSDLITEYLGLQHKLQTLPGVGSASFATLMPFSNWDMQLPVVLAGGSIPMPVGVNFVGGQFFQTMNIAVRRGRVLSQADVMVKRPVAVVSDAFARRMSPSEDVVGKSIVFLGRQLQIVGVCRDVEYLSVSGPPTPRLYVPFSLFTGIVQHTPNRLVAAIRTVEPESLVEEELRKEARSLDPGMEIGKVRTAREQVDASIAEQLMLARIAGAIGILSLALSSLGLYGFLSCSLASRRQELSIRLALGCAPGRLRRMVAVRVAAEVAAGLGAGLGLMLLEKQVLTGWIYGITVLDLRTVATAIAVFVAVSGLGFYFSTRALYRMNLSDILRR